MYVCSYSYIYTHCIDTCIATCHYMYHGYNIGIHICVPCTAFCHLELPFFFERQTRQRQVPHKHSSHISNTNGGRTLH